jgi:hypothetical protein
MDVANRECVGADEKGLEHDRGRRSEVERDSPLLAARLGLRSSRQSKHRGRLNSFIPYLVLLCT